MIECQPATTPVILGVFFRAFCFEINLIWNANTQTINCRRRDLVDQADLCPIASKHLWIDRVPVFSREILRKWLQVTNTFLGSATKAEFRETRNQGVSQASLKPRHACRRLGLTFFWKPSYPNCTLVQFLFPQSRLSAMSSKVLSKPKTWGSKRKFARQRKAIFRAHALCLAKFWFFIYATPPLSNATRTKNEVWQGWVERWWRVSFE